MSIIALPPECVKLERANGPSIAGAAHLGDMKLLDQYEAACKVRRLAPARYGQMTGRHAANRS
jgi:hypothetical protein